jgi:hypothetical protein
MKINLVAGLSLALLAGTYVADAQTTPPTTTPTAAQRAAFAGRQRALPFVEENTPATNYDYHELWKPFFFTKNGGEYRAASGEPGPKYWQNKADYQLSAKLNDERNEVTGSEILTYTNNSPQNLSFIWMQLDQNLFKLDSRGNKQVPLVNDPTRGIVQSSRNWGQGQEFDAGYRINSVKVLTMPVAKLQLPR